MQDLIFNECVLLFFWDLFEWLHVSERKEDENEEDKRWGQNEGSPAWAS